MLRVPSASVTWWYGGFLAGNRGQRIAEEFGVIHADRRDDSRERRVDHVGSVEPPAKAYFQQHDISRMLREQEKRRRGFDLEKRSAPLHGIACLHMPFDKLDFGDAFADIGHLDRPRLHCATSVIGPRPTLRYQVDRYDERQLHRLDVLPGITGPIMGQPETYLTMVGDAFDDKGNLTKEPLQKVLEQYLAAFAAFAYYHLIPMELAFALMALIIWRGAIVGRLGASAAMALAASTSLGDPNSHTALPAARHFRTI